MKKSDLVQADQFFYLQVSSVTGNHLAVIAQDHAIVSFKVDSAVRETSSFIDGMDDALGLVILGAPPRLG